MRTRGVSSVAKVSAIFDMATQNRSFHNKLKKDPYATLDKGGFDLSPGEILAVLDVLNRTDHSPYAALLGELRVKWEQRSEVKATKK